MNGLSLSQFYDVLDNYDWYDVALNNERELTASDIQVVTCAATTSDHMTLFKQFQNWAYSGIMTGSPKAPKPCRPVAPTR